MVLSGLDPRIVDEKRSGPRPLVAVGGALYAPPAPGSRRAWLAWLHVDPSERRRGRGAATLDAVIARARRDGATELMVGGPPGNYLVSGVDLADDDALGFFARRGFVERSRAVDLTVETEPAPLDPRVSSTDDIDVATWVASVFGEAWGREAEAARQRGGLYEARVDGARVGFAAHSGNNAALGSFGPVGVAPSARGSGLGAALSAAAFDGLHARGFATCTVPWVALETVEFYARRWRVRGAVTRALLRGELTRTGSP